MEKQTIEELVNLLNGISSSEWGRIKQQVDMVFSSQAAKVRLGNTTQLKRSLEVEFNLRRFGDTSD
ncbi:hypothetical protein CSV67_03090 [Sporosarcina sp. P2]|uniref:hypothetical protein n=1 Tax=Sporosarcina sp. P2 TaxID=2048251 RepID=UPI000C167F35|nr:hypothetical protein [Sporosarcina sp. P2]PID03643.1 hypothetical protein CSV67_03090 [Sporosarcina sp. P2]